MEEAVYMIRNFPNMSNGCYFDGLLHLGLCLPHLSCVVFAFSSASFMLFSVPGIPFPFPTTYLTHLQYLPQLLLDLVILAKKVDYFEPIISKFYFSIYLFHLYLFSSIR